MAGLQRSADARCLWLRQLQPSYARRGSVGFEKEQPVKHGLHMTGMRMNF